MHYLIPFASVGSDACDLTWQGLQLPYFHKLMQRMALHSQDVGDEYTLSPPHERVLAQSLGLWTTDGATPWTAHTLSLAPSDTGYQSGQAWAQITPCFWHVGTDQVQMLHPDGLQLTESDSREVLAIMQPYFAEDGIALHYSAPTRWVAHSPLFAGLATASLDRVVGRNVNAWMPEGAQAAPLRRLQNEMQMLLYTHAFNDRRFAAGQLPVNSFWVSGAGALAVAPPKATELMVVDDLRTPALHEDWAAWAAAWQQLDNGIVKDLSAKAWHGERVDLTLCGERTAQHWQSFTPTFGQRFTSLLGRKSL
ncbi:MAG: phosphoglycerate mutase [Burkholderiaceae bacterium]